MGGITEMRVLRVAVAIVIIVTVNSGGETNRLYQWLWCMDV